MKKTSLFILVIILFFSSGCATIVSKSNWPVSIDSNPSGANIIITDKHGVEIYNGQTPANLKLKSGSDFFARARYQVTFTKEGYQNKTIPIEFKTNGWYWGNILLGWVIGMLIVDPATGAMYKISNDKINETLIKNESGNTNGEVSLKIIDINDLNEEARASLVLLQ